VGKGERPMLVRNCAGGVVFHKDKVLILKNEKHEWVLPKGVIRSNNLPEDVAVERVAYEAGSKARIISPAGRTNYEFYSISRMRPVCNKIIWFIMASEDELVHPNAAQNFSDGGFYDIDEAMEMVTYSQDRSLLMLSYEKYKELV
jgi:ADP-ribose pyrophosphatase YjhB (NUDIX family)